MRKERERDSLDCSCPSTSISDPISISDYTMSDEEDFMSDAFLVEAEKRDVPETYAQRRKKAINRSIERGTVKSRQQREQEAREEALARNMVDDSEKNNKALAMMMKMGFKPGQALGQKRPAPPPDQPGEGEDTTDAQRARSDSPKVRIDPIEVEMRQGEEKHSSYPISCL
jgi:hypothetical protein